MLSAQIYSFKNNLSNLKSDLAANLSYSKFSKLETSIHDDNYHIKCLGYILDFNSYRLR